jgi:hypothetical protein
MSGIYPAWLGNYTTETETETVYIEVGDSGMGGGVFPDSKFYTNIVVTATININKKKKKKKPTVKAKLL